MKSQHLFISARWALAAMLLTGLALVATPARASGITVTTTVDELANNDTCSLREAIIAANTNSNSHEDACTAGEDATTDTITLDGGATYSLTLAGVTEDASASGDLDLLNNSTELDLILNSTGQSVIQQDASPDDRVIHILGASVEMTGLVISGGSDSGIYLPSGSLKFVAGRISGNYARKGGGGLLVGAGGTALLKGAEISGNVAGHQGGGIYNMGTLTLDRTQIMDNRAANNGGGLYHEGTAVTGTITTWLRNHAGENGGAIYNNINTANSLAISHSCLSDNDNTAVFNAQPAIQLADNNWWGSSDGPSGVGPGKGDSVSTNVDYSSFHAAPGKCTFTTNLIYNNGFERDGDANRVPDRWIAKKVAFSALKDGLDTTDFLEGLQSFRFKGSGASKKLTQDIYIAGSAGNMLELSVWNRTQNVTGSGKSRVLVKFFYTDGSTQTFELSLPDGTTDWTEYTLDFTAAKDYSKIRVRIQFSKAKGNSWFDDLSLIRGVEK